MDRTFTIVERVATVAELRSLARAVGWDDHFDWDTMQSALDGSLHGAVAVCDGHVLGAGRLVGDGSRYFYVQDVIVHPDASADGLATRLVDRLLTWVRHTAGHSAIVGLFSSPDAVGVYSSLGFVPASEDPVGMTQQLKGGSDAG
ncbi:GNAT family N-acetyltransferase [Microbacterium sp. Gd 4-13]|uniref:GNAT family N-acetyltransferase n=1 Tax=Microbacterium sp. Gd 4-13 TaxID=2173179 RepID=UPI001403B2CD|nr:GNAT family N-acetyltransferase [Microbacterium sp. Gd 4-13]